MENKYLGNNRITVSLADGHIEEVNHYYPFGGLMGDSRNATTQPYKYIGKELDRTHGLDWYDHGARHYDPVTGRWNTMDPMCEKYYGTSPYASCGDDPVNAFDPDGMAPGDIFTSADLAATDFGKYYNPRSIRESKEYASSIYKIIGRNGIIGFSYTFANKGNASECSPSLPILYEVVADAHTHGASSVNSEKKYYDNEFSGLRNENGKFISKEERKKENGNNDIGNANRIKKVSYLVTPNGSLQKYNPQNGEITIVSNDMPSDPNDPNRVNENTINYIEPIENDINKYTIY